MFGEGPQRPDLFLFGFGARPLRLAHRIGAILEVCILVVDSSAPASSPATLAGQSLPLHNRLPARLPRARVHIWCRIAQRSGKIGLKSDSFKNGTPGDPPVPFFAPMVRSTNLI